MRILAIDPGNIESGYVIASSKTLRPEQKGKVENKDLLEIMKDSDAGVMAIEKIASYGMPVGESVFDTCIWTGRFIQMASSLYIPHREIKRIEIKNHICHTSKAKDSNIAQALVDRFAKDTSNKGKGIKSNPGWFYGFKSDIWAAYALLVTFADNYADIYAPSACV